jgi:hypothetical protein
MESQFNRPLKVSFKPGSAAERHFRKALAATPDHDLLFHGGKTIANLHFENLYVGASSWQQDDVKKIDNALAAAMSDQHLNNVMSQYFNESISSAFDGSTQLPGPTPKRFSQVDVESLVVKLHSDDELVNRDLDSTVFNLLLPPGTILSDDSSESAELSRERRSSAIPAEDEADSLNGLGGFHGSVRTNGARIYYAVGVYSESLSNGQENGIVAFDQPWKNVVATFYHELNEARTDPDVDDAIRAGNGPQADAFLGWTSQQGEECGDFPVFEAGANLQEVFREVKLTNAKDTVPVQFQYSNAVHKPQGPIAHPALKARPAA